MPESHPEAVKISVVIAAYNAAAYIQETLESVLTQTYPPLEVIVVDDGSTDETAAIVLTYAGRVKLLKSEHVGISAARNLGIRQAQGDYIAFVDSDDLWLPEKLERQVACILEKHVVWVSCGADFFDDKTGKILPGYKNKLHEGDVLEQLFAEVFILSPTPVVKKSVFEEVGFFDESYEAHIGEDWDMWMRIAARYPLGMVYEILTLKREHPTSALSSSPIDEKVRLQALGLERAVSRHLDRLGPLKNRVLARLYLSHGATLLKQGQYEQARSLIAEARKLDPYDLKSKAYWLILSTGKVGIHTYSFFRKRYHSEPSPGLDDS